MSHGAISQPQFHEQLKMFMTPDEIIDTADKGDTLFSWEHKRFGQPPTPRDQWEAEGSGHHGSSLRDLKRENLSDWSKKRGSFDKPFETMPPVHLMAQQYSNFKDAPRRKLLVDGHHRLALAEHRGHPYIAVMHHTEDEWDEY
jgi:hypothetical protein